MYNTTFIRWTTHNPRGLSAKDVEMAGICDGAAKDFVEVEEPPEATAGSSNADLVENAKSGAGECCAKEPKK